MAVRTPIELDRGRIAELTAREAKVLDANTAASGVMYARANHVLSGGVASSYQLRDPWPIYLERGAGSQVWDVDGTQMIDFHNGFGSMVQGHAHPVITQAVTERMSQGTHFAAPTEDAIVALYGRFPGLKDVRLVAERGLAFVEYGEHAQAAAAQLALDGFKLTASSAMAVSFAV